MNSENLTGREYYEIFTTLEEYCKLKDAQMESDLTPVYVKDVSKEKLKKVKVIMEKMDKRMTEFPSECGCCAKY